MARRCPKRDVDGNWTDDDVGNDGNWPDGFR